MEKIWDGFRFRERIRDGFCFRERIEGGSGVLEREKKKKKEKGFFLKRFMRNRDSVSGGGPSWWYLSYLHAAPEREVVRESSFWRERERDKGRSTKVFLWLSNSREETFWVLFLNSRRWVWARQFSLCDYYSFFLFLHLSSQINWNIKLNSIWFGSVHNLFLWMWKQMEGPNDCVFFFFLRVFWASHWKNWIFHNFVHFFSHFFKNLGYVWAFY